MVTKRWALSEPIFLRNSTLIKIYGEEFFMREVFITVVDTSRIKNEGGEEKK